MCFRDRYLTKLSVNDQAVFVLLGDAGVELTGKQTAVLVESYFEVNSKLPIIHLIEY